MSKEQFISEINNILKEKNKEYKLINIKEYIGKDFSKSKAEHISIKYIDFYFENFTLEKIPGSIEQGAEEFIDIIIEEINEKELENKIIKLLKPENFEGCDFVNNNIYFNSKSYENWASNDKKILIQIKASKKDLSETEKNKFKIKNKNPHKVEIIISHRENINDILEENKKFNAIEVENFIFSVILNNNKYIVNNDSFENQIIGKIIEYNYEDFEKYCKDKNIIIN